MVDRIFIWADDRLGISGSGRKLLNKIFPDHWSFLIGEIALYSFIVLLGTGVFLTLYFVPSQSDVIYHGSYLPLQGQHMSEAYQSTVNLSFNVRGGLLMRQMHHWAANIFVGAIVVHMLRVFFTGAFRRPRELNWFVGSTMLILAIFNGFLGYSLPDDLVSGTGIRIAFSILESVPVVGTYLAFWLFGGNFPGTAIIPRFFILHVLLLPAIIAGLLGAHLGMLVRQKHTQFNGKGRTKTNVVGAPLFPTFAAKTGGFFFLTTAVTVALSFLAQINPIWLYGPYVSYHVSYAVQPDWYMGWLDGALRIMPPWELQIGNFMIPNAFFPGVLLPGITFGILQLWPWIEAKITGDYAEHHVLERPRDRPKRTAFGAAVFSFYFVLFGASATDVLANYLDISLNVVLWSFRLLIFVVPAIVYPVTFYLCKELQHTPGSGKRKRHNIVMRSAAGAYSTIQTEERAGDAHEELDPFPLDEGSHDGSTNGSTNGSHDGAASPDLVPALAGAAVAAGAASVDDGGDGAPERRRGRGGIFRIPRNYR